MRKNLIRGTILGGLAVIGGAFGAHLLKEILSDKMLVVYQTGIRYQMIHAIVLLFIGILLDKYNQKQFRWAGKFIFWGVILFSGSIYILTFKDILGMEFLKFVGPITPTGGLLIILGWAFLLLGALKLKE